LLSNNKNQSSMLLLYRRNIAFVLLVLIILLIARVDVVMPMEFNNGLKSLTYLSQKTYYTAAVVEFYPRGSPALSPNVNIDKNLVAIEKYVARASKNDTADIIIFPEAVLWTYGLISVGNSSLTPRELIQAYGETIPPVGSIPCDDNTRNTYGGSTADDKISVSKQISCMSRKYKITLVINTIDLRPCSRGTDINCPLDGRYQYNTDVVFDGQSGGKIVAIYHKYHLFGTYPILNYPLKPEVVSFHSSFGVTFGIFICFDITFVHPVQNLLKQGIKHFLFSTWWYNSAPVFTATMFQQAFSRKFHSVLLAANTGSSYLSSGSGIYQNGNVVRSHYNSSTFNQDTYIVANVTKTIDVSSSNVEKNDIKYKDYYNSSKHRTMTDVILPCKYDSASLINTGYCVPFSNLNYLSKKNETNVDYKLTVPGTNFSCSIQGTIGNNELYNPATSVARSKEYVLFASRGTYIYYNRHAGGNNITLLVETCAVFHCSDILHTNDNQNNNKKERVWGKRASNYYYNCASNFNATQSFSSITLMGSFTQDTVQYSMIGIGDNVELVHDTSDVITEDGYMKWKHNNAGHDKLFSALIYGILQK
jgi:predicted amidohydrolase